MEGKQKNIDEKIKEEDLVNEIYLDYQRRKEEKRPYELSFELNMNFVAGNQNTYITSNGNLQTIKKEYPFEKREVFNHCAPIVETRLAKLARVRPTMSVRPSSSSESDIACAKLGKNILDSFSVQRNLGEIIAEATLWSEVCGTSFYKVVWDRDIGALIGKNKNNEIVHLGDVSISVCSPFEIFPDSCSAKDLNSCESLMYVKAYPVDVIKDAYNIEVEGEDLDVFTFNTVSNLSFKAGNSNITKYVKSTKKNHALVIEKYERPSKDYPNGRLVIVAGKKIVFDGDLPYMVGDDFKRDFPFVRQICTQVAGQFWGVSVVERCIPIQRAYNAIKNRKHEFIGRLASGVLAVEDGSVDTDDLEEEGLAPGKILIYRAGSNVPNFLNIGSIPTDFSREEDRLLDEFITVSGVSELMRGSNVPSGVSSGTALNLLIEQDDTRLSVTADNIRSSIKEVAKKVIRLYKQFASVQRLSKTTNEDGEIELFYWSGSDLTSDDVVLDTANEMTETPAQRRNTVMELLTKGLLYDEDGKLTNRMRARVLDMMGYGNWDNALDLINLQTKRACKENLRIIKLDPPEIFDDHEIHIEEHTKFLLSKESEKFGKEHIEKLKDHLLLHKKLNSLGNEKIEIGGE